MMQALTPEQQQQVLEQELLRLYGDPTLGGWTPRVPRPGPGDPLTQGEFEWLITLRQMFCRDTAEFDYWIGRMKAERGGAPPQDLLQALNAIESNESLVKAEPCDKSYLFPRAGHNLAPPRAPQPDPQPWMPAAPIRLPQPPPPPQPNAFALAPAKQKATLSPAAAPVQTRLRTVLLSGHAQRQREQAATGKLVTVYGKTRHAAMIMANIYPVDVRSGEPDHLYDISYELEDGRLADDELDRFVDSLELNMRMRGYKTCRWRALAHSVLFVIGANGVADKKVLRKILQAHAMDPNGPRLLLSK